VTDYVMRLLAFLKKLTLIQDHKLCPYTTLFRSSARIPAFSQARLKRRRATSKGSFSLSFTEGMSLPVTDYIYPVLLKCIQGSEGRRFYTFLYCAATVHRTGFLRKRFFDWFRLTGGFIIAAFSCNRSWVYARSGFGNFL